METKSDAAVGRPCPQTLSCRDAKSLRRCLTYLRKLKAGEILDLRKLGFVDIAALVLVHFIARRVKPIYFYPPTSKGARDYVMDQLGKETSRGYVLRSAPNRYPIRWVRRETQLPEELDEWREMLVRSDFADDESARSFARLMSEVLTNSFVHGKTGGPCILGGQTFPKTGHSLLAAVDFGLTIPHTLRACGHYTDMGQPDEYWLSKSLELGVTARTLKSNRGVGLYALAEKVRSNGGTLTMVSGDGLLKMDSGAEPKAEPLGRGQERFPGTLILLDLRGR